MINIVKKELEFDDELKKKIEFICGFCNTTPIIINGNIRKIDRTNLLYIEPHSIILTAHLKIKKKVEILILMLLI